MRAAMLVRLYGCSSELLGDNVTENSLILWLLQSFHPLFPNDPQALGAGVVL